MIGKILLLAPNGQVGWELQRSLQVLGEVVPLTREEGAHCGDLTRPEELGATVRSLRPDLIVNAAAYTAVDKAETEPELARAVNAHGVAVLAREAAALGARLVHYSTDYVFDGSGDEAWSEEAPTGPLNVYGQTKLEGEDAIRTSGCRHLIFRTSWVYAARGGNFAKTMLRLAAERDELRVVGDQVGSPTGADLIADVTALVLRSDVPDGTYHLAASGFTNWCEYARFVIGWAQAHGKALRATPISVRPVSSAEYPSPAKRPLNSRLSTSRLCAAARICLPDWKVGVQRMLEEAYR